MTLDDLKMEISKYQYFEDTDVIDVALASIISTRLHLGDPIWLVLIGASSGGKSQILRPLAITDERFMHRVDDLTENTFLSGMNGEGSLLQRIGKSGIIVISDLTVLFSKNSESSSAILSQFRMIYDGEMIKYTGNKKEPIRWKGSLGILAGSTPSIYNRFEEFADMGERFIYYRMKNFDIEKATRLALTRKEAGKELDDKLSCFYKEYLKELTKEPHGEINLPEELKDRIISISAFAEKVRTIAHTDKKNSDIDRIPVSAMPMRVALQLTAVSKGLWIMRNGEMTERDYRIIEWCGYSLANEEKRTCLRILARIKYGAGASTQTIADLINLSTDMTRRILQNLTATDIVVRTGSSDSLTWRINRESDWNIVRRVEQIDTLTPYGEREVSGEEKSEADAVAEQAWREIPEKTA